MPFTTPFLGTLPLEDCAAPVDAEEAGAVADAGKLLVAAVAAARATATSELAATDEDFLFELFPAFSTSEVALADLELFPFLSASFRRLPSVWSCAATATCARAASANGLAKTAKGLEGVGKDDVDFFFLD